MGKVQLFVLFFKLQFREPALCDVIEGGDVSLTCRHPQVSDLPSPFHLSVGSSLVFFASKIIVVGGLKAVNRGLIFSSFFGGSR